MLMQTEDCLAQLCMPPAPVGISLVQQLVQLGLPQQTLSTYCPKLMEGALEGHFCKTTLNQVYYEALPLHDSVHFGRIDIIQYLLDAGVSVDARSRAWIVTDLSLSTYESTNADKSENNTALMLAASSNHWKIVNTLLKHGAKLDLQNSWGRTALIEAASCACMRSLLILIDKGADLELGDIKGCTALMFAAQRDHSTTLKILIESGAALESQNYNGQASMSIVVERGHKECVKILVEAGADVRLQNADDFGYTPLLWAAIFGYSKIIELLLDHGATIEVRDLKGRTALSIAALDGHIRCVDILLQRGAAVDVHDDDKKGYPPLTWAASRGHTKVVQLLPDKGACIEKCSRNGRRALSLAAEMGQVNAVKALLRQGAIIDAHDETKIGSTPLHMPALKGQLNTVEVLLEAGADINAVNTKYGHISLMGAAFGEHSQIVRKLLTSGADVRSMSKDGRTAADLVTKGVHQEIGEMLNQALSQSRKQEESTNTKSKERKRWYRT